MPSGLAIVRLLGLTARPTDAVLGELPGQEGYQDVAEHPEATTVPGLIIYRFNAAPLFFNAGFLAQRIRAVVAAAPVKPRWFLYSAEGGNLLDFTAAEALEQVHGELAAQGITFALARPRGRFNAMLHQTGLAARIGEDRIFPSVQSGVKAFRESATLTTG